MYCNSLTSVTIGNSVTKIGEDAFYGCESLKGVYISDLSTWCRIDFGNKWEWSHAEYANPLYYAKNLYLNGELITKLIIPSDIKEVKKCAFLNCNSLINVTIPSNITAIGKKAFWGCNIDTIICRAMTPPKLFRAYHSDWKGDGLTSFESFETLIVPVGSEEVYSKSEWGEYIDGI